MPHRMPGLNLLHIVWATKYRRALIAPHCDETLVGILGAQAKRVGSILLAGGCASDHVHVVVRLGVATPLAELVRSMKGGSAHDVNRRRLGRRIEWQAGYWAESFGPSELEQVTRYVRSQRNHHDPSNPLERWQIADRE